MKRIILGMLVLLGIMLPLSAYAGIQAMIDAASDGTVGSPTIVSIPAGTYNEHVMILGRNYLTIQPASGTVTLNGTLHLERANVTGYPACKGVTVKDLIVVGTAGHTNMWGDTNGLDRGEGPEIGVVKIGGGTDCKIEGCTVTANVNFWAGIRVLSMTYSSFGQAVNNTIEGNSVYGSALNAGIEIRGDGALGPVGTDVIDNEVFGVAWYGLWNTGTAFTGGNTVYSGNYVHDVGFGINVDRDNTLIADNVIEPLIGGVGIGVYKPVSGQTVTVTGNEVSGAFYGIAAYGDGISSGAVYSDNYIHDSPTYNGPVGIYIDSDKEALIQGNVIANISTHAVSDANPADNPVIDHNTFYNIRPNYYAVRFGGTTAGGTLMNNIFAKNLGDMVGPYAAPVPSGVTESNNLFWRTDRYYTTPWSQTHLGDLMGFWPYDNPPSYAWVYNATIFASEDPANASYLYLSCDTTPVEVLKGDSAGSFMGALPTFTSCCLEGDEALLAACIEGRELVKDTEGWDQPRNSGKGKGQGVLLNMPLIAEVASDYVDSLDICNDEDADELHSCIVSYFASGGKSSHFGE